MVGSTKLAAVLLFGVTAVTDMSPSEQLAPPQRAWTRTADELWEIDGVPGRSMTFVVERLVAPGEPIAYGLVLGARGTPLSWTATTYLGRDTAGISLEKSSGTVATGDQCAKMYADGLKAEHEKGLLVAMTVIACKSFGGGSERQELRLPLPPTSFEATLPAVPVFIPRLVIRLTAESDSGLRVGIGQTVVGRGGR